MREIDDLAKFVAVAAIVIAPFTPWRAFRNQQVTAENTVCGRWMRSRVGFFTQLVLDQRCQPVMALPKQIADIASQNKREIYNLLMRASADTVIRIAADPKHLGARVGITSVLHTWGSAMTHHPHVHMIVPGGGLSKEGSKWITCRKNFFLSVRVLYRLYRRLILEGLSKLHKAGKLDFFGEHANPS